MNAAIIVAAGAGLRMGAATRKQYLTLKGIPILSHTVRVFDMSPDIHQICLVVPEGEIEFCRRILSSLAAPRLPLTIVAGGLARQDSVWSGIEALRDLDGMVAIHDGVRPFITQAQLSDCIRTAAVHGACILAVPVTDTLKSVSADGLILNTLDREGIWAAQTPQVFQYHLIRKAYAQARQNGILATDDAMILEKTIGVSVKIVAGSRDNIKITTPEDLVIAAALMEGRGMKTGG